MALTDIIRRIETDADVDADAIVLEAKEQAKAVMEETHSRATVLREHAKAEAERAARRDAETMLANARLRARDRALSARHEMVERVFVKVEQAIVDLQDDEYARLLAKRLVAAARGGETVRLGAEDAERLGALLPDAVRAEAALVDSKVELIFAKESMDLGRGVLLEGERMTVELSPRSIVAVKRDELAGQVDELLFSGPEEGV